MKPAPTHSTSPAPAGEHMRPVTNWPFSMGFDLFLKAVYRREVLLPPDFRLLPGTLIASNHQRDVDGPMLGSVLVCRRGLRFCGSLPFFATREDLFRPGILARLTVHWPRPLSALLRQISLAWFFPLGRTEPIRRTREFTLGDALRALSEGGLGDADTGSLLNARGLRETGVRPGDHSVDALLERSGDTLETMWGLRRLGAAARATLAPGFRATVERQLAQFAQRLDRGCSVYFSPEGTISKDGRFGRTRAGFSRVARKAESAPWVQPMALAYDTLAPGRSRVVMRIGPRFRANTTLDRRAFNAHLRHTILDLVPITPSHLVARFLVHGPESFAQQEFTRWLSHGLANLRVARRSLDPLWTHTQLNTLADQRVRWLERQGLVQRHGAAFRNACDIGAPPGWRAPANVVRYLDNQLSDSVPDIERLAPC